jgi:DDE_Tnp_1-associated
MLLDFLGRIPDTRRGQGKRYDLPNLLLVTIFAVLSGAKSYRQIHSFMSVHFRTLKKHLGLSWREVPSYTGLHTIIRGLSSTGLENAFRHYSSALAAGLPEDCIILACDGKALRGSFDNMADRRAAEILSVFAHDSQLILAHKEIAEKTNEIPAFQQLVSELGLSGKLFTLDAMHAQKNSAGG